ncbi:MAG: 23S rRNA (adenine(2503)-C(2))-methyltransferase RlmN [Propionibacteriaceae bacterium]|jgi:23S rRNA (adenine2503-C2)-methyltransferase|nr:23S rRNA (adenine(2503)-C(2))-methyltransferase RlmN [Propionibacteriaceae bacterium]
MTHWLELSKAERVDAVIALGLPKFRAAQLSTHLFEHLSDDPDTWTDIPKSLRAQLAEQFLSPLLSEVTALRADRGKTVKTLWRLSDGNLIESVLMRYPGRDTLCISCQAGCGMACPFCATGQGGLQRALTVAEMALQVFRAAQACARGDLPGGPGRLSHVVFMGMGEPMANFPRVLATLKLLTAPTPDGFGLSARNITVSTVGLVSGIKRLADSGIPVTLAISLHAPDDALRNELCPINKRIPIAEVIAAAHDYFQRTGRRVSIEYALIRDINDQAWRAERLANILNQGGHAWVHVNLIPLNPTPGSKWTASRPDVEAEFIRRLERAHVTVTLRDTRGSDIDGACGQLATS